ncbi:MAG: GspE/PulE family protein, partial [Patescibacteria group bacterium]
MNNLNMPSSPNSIFQATEEKGREQLTGQIQIPSSLVKEVRAAVQNLAQLKEKLTGVAPEGVTNFLHILLIASLSLQASDAHIEPEEDEAKIRLRIDGLLHDLINLSLPVYEALLSRIKLTSRIKLNISDKPQDGRFSFILGEDLVEARVATLPAEYGEAVVLRVLNPKNLIELGALGLRPEILQTIRKELQRPNGMIAATGPTGSGKTTTLYAFLKEIQKPEIKIITIEDPIEYHLEGISQTQVHPEKGYDFASGLSAIVRQDPDAILVGEIRDKATAQIALQAALTGHLVLSTLHTNDAPGTISRLTSLGAEPLNIGAASNMIIGQRLVRKVCARCTIFTKATVAELAQIKKDLQKLKEAQFSAPPQTLKLARPQGCEECNATGYRGRIGVFEVIIVDSAMEEFILQKPSASALRKFAIKQGMNTMNKDGLLKVIQGL